MRARLSLTLTGADGRLVTARQARNAVMQGGAGLIAQLFAGRGEPITHMGVGTNGTPEDGEFTTTELTNAPDGDIPALVGGTRAALTADAFAFVTEEAKRVVKVRVRATLPPDAAVGRVREAGLLSVTEAASVLYNRVTFAPVDKGDDHELTMFWEVEFPYGDLQWLL